MSSGGNFDPNFDPRNSSWEDQLRSVRDFDDGDVSYGAASYDSELDEANCGNYDYTQHDDDDDYERGQYTSRRHSNDHPDDESDSESDYSNPSIPPLDDNALPLRLQGAPPLSCGLGKALNKATPGNSGTGKGRAKGKAKAKVKNLVKEQKVTFHSRIKSSGYGVTSAPQKMFQQPQNTNKYHREKLIAKREAKQRLQSLTGPEENHAAKKEARGVLPVRVTHQFVPFPFNLPTGSPQMPKSYDISPHQSAAFRDGFSSGGASNSSSKKEEKGYGITACKLFRGGRQLVVGDAEGGVLCFPMAEKGGLGTRSHLSMLGHDAPVQSLCGSFACSEHALLLTTAAGRDDTVRLWSMSGTQAGNQIFKFNSAKSSNVGISSDTSPLKDVGDAIFVCLDGAIAVAASSRLLLYKYALLYVDHHDDVKRLQKLGGYSLTASLDIPPDAGKHIQHLAARNDTLSPLVVGASSAKSLLFYDLVAEKVVREVREAHARPITSLRIQESSSEDLTYSMSSDGTVCLWDLRRLTRPARIFAGAHKHASLRAQPSLSPCLRYMSVPSEDGRIVTYDVSSERSFEHFHRNNSLAISAVEYDPRLGTLVSAGLDGVVRFCDEGGYPVSKKKRGGMRDRLPYDRECVA